METKEIQNLNRIFKEDVQEAVNIKGPLKDLLEELKKVGTTESDKLYEDTVRKYTQVDTSKWDLEIEPDAYNNFTKVLEETESELKYSNYFRTIDKENKIMQQVKMYEVTPLVSTLSPYFLKGFIRKNGYIHVSVEDVLKYIASDGELFVTPLSTLQKFGIKKQSKLGFKFRK